MAYHNLAREYSTTTGTSDAVLTTAVPGCNTWILAGVTNGEAVEYTIITYDTATNRPTHTEVGQGTFTTSTKTLARTTVESSTNGGSKIVMTGLSEVFITPPASGFVYGGFTPFASYYYSTTDSINNATNGAALSINTEWRDDSALASVATNTITVAKPGWYYLSLIVHFTAASAFNGRIVVYLDSLLSKAQGYVTADGLLEDYIQVGPTLNHITASSTLVATLDNHCGFTLTADVYEYCLTKFNGKAAP